MNSEINIIVPLAGEDKNFENLGDHKALTKVFGKTVIEWIAESRPYDMARATFILLKEHDRRFNLASRLRGIFGKRIGIVWAQSPTGGAPQSVLLCTDQIDNEIPLLIDLPDQYIDFKDFMSFVTASQADGVIPSFESLYFNRGYMILQEGTNQVLRVSEKDKVPISTHSTACVSYFRHGHDFVWAARKMLEEKHVAANGAYLISLVFNELIEAGKLVMPYPCEFIATLGSIEGVKCFDQIARPVRYK